MKSLQSLSVPEEWKQAFITLFIKKASAAKHHSISLTSTTGKILESIIRDQMYQHLIAS